MAWNNIDVIIYNNSQQVATDQCYNTHHYLYTEQFSYILHYMNLLTQLLVIIQEAQSHISTVFGQFSLNTYS